MGENLSRPEKSQLKYGRISTRQAKKGRIATVQPEKVGGEGRDDDETDSYSQGEDDERGRSRT